MIVSRFFSFQAGADKHTRHEYLADHVTQYVLQISCAVRRHSAKAATSSVRTRKKKCRWWKDTRVACPPRMVCTWRNRLTNQQPSHLVNRTKQRTAMGPQPVTEQQTLQHMAAHPSPLPGNSTRTDSLSFIPTLTEDKRAEPKKDTKKSALHSIWLVTLVLK